MTLQVCPPELLEQLKIRLKLKKLNHIGNQAHLKMENQKNFDCLDVTKPATQSWAGNMHPRLQDPKTGDLRFNGYVVTRSHPGTPADIARETDWSKAERPKIDGTFVKPRRFLAWVATSASRGRLEVLFIEQKSIREQLTEILQEIEDYTWTEEGLANFSIKISKKGSWP